MGSNMFLSGMIRKLLSSTVLVAGAFAVLPYAALSQDVVKVTVEMAGEADPEFTDDPLADEDLATEEELSGLRCKVTPAIDPTFIPLKAIKKSSNLLRKAGSPERARGRYIQFRGRVVGEDCVPVSNAVVQIWQADSAGKYDANYEMSSEWDVADEDYDPNFAYTGTAQTNNAGEFMFLTILPGVIDGRAPHINMSVNQSDFEDVITKIFFEKHPRNGEDPDFKELSPVKQQLVSAHGQELDPGGKLEGRVYNVTITLRGIHKYKRF